MQCDLIALLPEKVLKFFPLDLENKCGEPGEQAYAKYNGYP